jgi:hypothetical protein
VAADERAQARFCFTRKGSRKDHDSSKRARFTIDGRIGPFVVGPDLRSSERDKKAEDKPNGGSIPGEIALNARPRSPCARAVTSPQIPAATKYVKPNTTSAIQTVGRLCSQSGMFRSAN